MKKCFAGLEGFLVRKTIGNAFAIPEAQLAVAQALPIKETALHSILKRRCS